MSFRNTFTTDFIYQASHEVLDANKAVTEVFERWCGSTLVSKVDERGYGFYSGFFKTLSGTLHEVADDMTQLVHRLENATKVPFTLTILLESGPQLTYHITPPTNTP